MVMTLQSCNTRAWLQTGNKENRFSGPLCIGQQPQFHKKGTSTARIESRSLSHLSQGSLNHLSCSWRDNELKVVGTEGRRFLKNCYKFPAHGGHFVDRTSNVGSALCRLGESDVDEEEDASLDFSRWSIIIPTYNRLPILDKCLTSLEEQVDYFEAGIKDYEVLVIDDGSSDGTLPYLELKQDQFPHVKLLSQNHAGAAVARNYGVQQARGSVIVFIDSDMVVAKEFLRSHATALANARVRDGDDRAFSYGPVVNTSNFHEPTSEKFKITDHSAAFFATGNVAITRRRLREAARLLESAGPGPFDASFSEYGWEDLELGERLRQQGMRLVGAPGAVGFHFHPSFSPSQIPRLIEQERQRGRNGLKFYRKHPNWNVRLMIQMTPLHEFLWLFLTFGGHVTENTLEPLLQFLVDRGHWRLAYLLLSPTLNWHTVQALKEEIRKSGT